MPKLLAQVNGLAPAEVWSTAQPNAPLAHVSTLPLLQLVRKAPNSLVVEAAPVLSIEKSVVVADAVDEPIAKRVVLVSPLFACIAKRAKGVEVPMPTVLDAIAVP